MGLTLAEIGSILCLPDEDDELPSILETLVKEAEVSSSQFDLPLMRPRS